MALPILLITNLVAFVTMGIDKWLARTQRRRVPELQLHMLGLLCGGVGAWLGMGVFRHKTRKLGFKLRMAAVTLLGAGAWVAWFFV